MKIKDILFNSQADIVKSYLNGFNTCQLGKKYGCSNASVYIFLRDECGITMRQAPKISDYHNKIEQLVNEGYSGCKIADKLDLSSTSVRRYMKKNNLKVSDWKPHEKPLKDYQDEIVNLYKDGYSADKIGKRFGYHETSILEFLRKCNVQIRDIRTYAVDESFFKNIDTEAKAYILGFAYGDSYNDGNSFRTVITDKEIVEMIKVEMQFAGPIKEILPIRDKAKKISYNLTISSRKICRDLTKKGCMRAKSHIIKFPTNDIVPDHLIHHWCRGLVDADGTLGQYGQYNKLSFSITGSKDLLFGLREYLLSKFDYGGSNCLAYPNSDRIYKWSAGGNIACKKFAHWIYDDATIYLTRKHDIAKEYFLT